MGIYRLVLAVLVVVSHTGIAVGGFNEGVVAVVQFFLLSGFVMTALVSRHYPTLDRYGAFLLDRLARIGPQFYLYLAVTVVGLAALGGPSARALSLPVLLLNVLIVPLDVLVCRDPSTVYVLQTWSLGLEATFYLLFPVLFVAGARRAAAALSVAVFLVAVAGWIDTDAFGYRLLPGTLFIFLLGSFVHDARHGPAPRWLWASWAASAALLVAVVAVAGLDRPYTKEVALGLTLGLPLLWALRRQPSGRFDAAAGDLSYGVFLSHYGVVLAARRLGLPVGEPIGAGAVVLLSLGLAQASYTLVERPFLGLRRSLRGRRPAALARA